MIKANKYFNYQQKHIMRNNNIFMIKLKQIKQKIYVKKDLKHIPFLKMNTKENGIPSYILDALKSRDIAKIHNIKQNKTLCIFFIEILKINQQILIKNKPLLLFNPIAKNQKRLKKKN